MSLVDQGNLLVAFGFFDGIMGTARHIETLFEKLKTEFCLTFLIILDSDKLVNTNKIFGNFTHDLLQISFDCLFECCF